MPIAEIKNVRRTPLQRWVYFDEEKMSQLINTALLAHTFMREVIELHERLEPLLKSQQQNADLWAKLRESIERDTKPI